uniref:Grainyhead-like protein 3 homolog n=1 Tax=Maylandia zebra TaxID=106582 RepID=A0A3P9B7R2_9CICH
MDSWSYLDNSITEPNPSKSRLPEELTALSMFYEQNLHQTNEISPLDTSAIAMKILSENLPIQPSNVLGSKQIPQISVPATSETYTSLTSVVENTYDKQELSNFFELLQKWPENTAFPDPSTENLPYSDPFPENHSSPRSRSEFQFSLGAPAASSHKPSELPMVYLNKGQFYPITLHGVESSTCITATKVKTVVMAVFENDKSPEMQLRFWNHWHGRQPTVKQRVIDIADYKEAFSNVSNVEEVAFNALSFVWNPSEEAKVYIGINSLSTDFSSQKGVKGLPLNLQIDTYDLSSGNGQMIHRTALQVKIFCDKGAERKMRDEERKRSKRRGKNTNDGNTKSLVSSSIGNECTFFQTLDDHITQPVLFIPETHLSSLQRMVGPHLTTVLPPPIHILAGNRAGTSKAGEKKKNCGKVCVLLYVRTNSEEVFDALMLNSPTLSGLREAISEKYGLQKETIGKIYKKCRRGIFVNMDDNIIQHYTNQSAFLIEVSELGNGQFQVTLVEV